MFSKILLFVAITLSLNADIALNDIKSKPSGRAKNFMIWQYLKQDITAKQADEAYNMVDGNVAKINKAYLKKSKNKELLKKIRCRSRKDLLSINEKECFKLAMNPYKTLKMDNKTRKKLLTKLNSKKLQDAVRIQSEPYVESAYMKYSSNTVLGMFLRVPRSFRRDKLNLELSNSFVQHMFSKESSKSRSFSLIKVVMNDPKLKKLQKSLLQVNPDNVDSDANFLLGLNHLKHSSTKKALKHFKFAKKQSYQQEDKDKNTFWMYIVSQDKKYLEKLTKSSKINIYTQYAHDILNKEQNNYFTTVKVSKKKSDKNICDPFVWSKIIKEIQQTPKKELIHLAEKYKQNNMEAVQAYIIQKAHDFKKHGYIMPYDEYLRGLSNDEKALVYALMRQESQLIPSALSRSFALGLMQIMPFVTDDLSKRMKKPITCYDDMFKPDYNIKYALKHLKWLNKSFYHPLFTAYAYNGGHGFLRKHLKKGTFKEGKYEPFLSMELMSNRESREYGKKVLSNYVMYKKILGEKISIVTLLNSLTDPKKTDRYRSKS